MILFIAGWISWIKLWEMDPYAISHRYIQTLFPHPQVYFAITGCFLILSVRQTHKNVCGCLCCIGYLADTLISASLPLFQYVDTQIESWPYSLSPSTEIAIAVLNQL